MSETTETPDTTPEDVDSNDLPDPEPKTGWWSFETKDAATDYVNSVVEKRLARERKKHEAALADYGTLKAEVERLKPLEDATKTDAQRWESEKATLAKELEDLRSFKSKAERDHLVRQIAEDKGLPAKFVARVRGDDEESIASDIEDLLTVINDGKPAKPASRKPVDPEEKPGSKGYGGGGSKSDNDDKAVVDNILKKFREQQHRTFAR